MVEPVSTTAIIEAASAVVGAVSGAVGAAPAGDSGVQVQSCSFHYPKEVPEELFDSTVHKSVMQDAIKFHADGAIWDNDLAVGVSGYVSNNHAPLVGRPNTAHPNVPANRFMVLHLDKSAGSEDMSGGLLTVNIELFGGGDTAIAEGTAEDPWVALHVHGRFDPRSAGDVEYEFKMYFDSFGNVHLGQTSWSGTYNSFNITHAGDHILVNMVQGF
jgi:hypothetical protein